MLAIIFATVLTFSITLSQSGTNVVLRYPTGDKLQWLEVCVETAGYGKSGEWNTLSCWIPRFKTEDFKLNYGTVRIKAHLHISEDGHRSWLHTPVIQVRPEPSL